MSEQLHLSKHKPWYASNIYMALLFGICLLLLFGIRAYVFLTANFMVDSDQPFLWAGARDYANGLFYEPRFYGQDYNTFMEPLFAVPLIWLRIPVYFAVPFATHFIFLFPFIFTASYLFAKGKKINAILTLLILLCTTPAYDILTSLPRGFVTGMFFCSFYVLSFVNPKNFKYFALNLVFTLIGFFVNPNVLVVAAPLMIYLLLINYRDKLFYIIGFSALLLLFPLDLFFNHFYVEHPDYVIYGLVHSYSFKYFVENIRHLDQVFAHISFFVENVCWPLLASFLLLGIFLFRKENKKPFWTFVLFLFVILCSFVTGKTREGSIWPYYSYGRMYIGIPLVLALFLSVFEFERQKWLSIICCLLLIYPSYKLLNVKENVDYHTQEKHWIGVHLVKLDYALEAIKGYKQACDRHNVRFLVVANIFWLNTFLTYGGPAIYKDYPETQETNSDHRYWVWEANKKRVIDRFMLLSINRNFDNLVRGKYPFETESIDGFGLFLIKNNRLTNGEFISIVQDIED